ncbi:MAG: SlyX family protein [Methylicorpusculum sp.]|uniref:SlyX family protein n=1 Tax=Methylicorpusculum sp. TaxID=2713644 RepID=UPI00271BD5C6|nr:SlyX family protein [Methylicorpusculum sp.]MDO8843473.1 SlyX family protein [Methylicorpusculum sp.]MDP2180717.1 SlyX family protein [Methylicorpusculum sp.]MDZ4140434.1 SlyX family protein [Methylotenera sp.]
MQNDDQIVELQIKIAFQEDLIQELNETVISQQAQIDRLNKAFSMINDRITSVCEEIGYVNQGEEIPPHY